jgi:hypothetical protein
MKISSMLSSIVPFCCNGVGETTLTKKFKLNVFGVETCYLFKSKEISNDTIMLDDLVSTPVLDRQQ